MIRTAYGSGLSPCRLPPSSRWFPVTGGLLRAPASLHDWVHRNWGRTELWAAGVRTRVTGLEHVTQTAPQIFVANHQSIFDIFAILAHVPASVRFVAKKELGPASVSRYGHARRGARVHRSEGSSRSPRGHAPGRGADEARPAVGRPVSGGHALSDGPNWESSRGGRSSSRSKHRSRSFRWRWTADTGFRLGGGFKPGGCTCLVAEPLPTEGKTADDRDEVRTAVRERNLRHVGGGESPRLLRSAYWLSGVKKMGTPPSVGAITRLLDPLPTSPSTSRYLQYRYR